MEFTESTTSAASIASLIEILALPRHDRIGVAQPVGLALLPTLHSLLIAQHALGKLEGQLGTASASRSLRVIRIM